MNSFIKCVQVETKCWVLRNVVSLHVSFKTFNGVLWQQTSQKQQGYKKVWRNKITRSDHTSAAQYVEGRGIKTVEGRGLTGGVGLESYKGYESGWIKTTEHKWIGRVYFYRRDRQGRRRQERRSRAWIGSEHRIRLEALIVLGIYWIAVIGITISNKARREWTSDKHRDGIRGYCKVVWWKKDY